MRDIPADLLARPFTSKLARAVGVTPRQLQGARCRRLFQDVYVGAHVPITPELLAAAASLILPAGAVVGGTMAALLHGADVRRRGDMGVGVIVSREASIRRRGIRVNAALLEPGDVVVIGGIPVTSAVRTAFDLARTPNLIESVVGVDAMLNRGGCTLAELVAYVASHRGWRGVRWADAALLHAEPKAESPMETRQRMQLVLAGLPRPTAQLELYAAPTLLAPQGLFVARLDHGYEEWRVAPEWDGELHGASWREDNERHERVQTLGWWHRRYTAISIQAGWGAMIGEVRAALLAAGWRP